MHMITDYYATGLYTYKKLLLSFYHTCFIFINQRSNKVCCVTWLVASFILCLVSLLAASFFCVCTWFDLSRFINHGPFI